MRRMLTEVLSVKAFERARLRGTPRRQEKMRQWSFAESGVAKTFSRADGFVCPWCGEVYLAMRPLSSVEISRSGEGGQRYDSGNWGFERAIWRRPGINSAFG